jgi:hypothetical protein
VGAQFLVDLSIKNQESRILPAAASDLVIVNSFAGFEGDLLIWIW